MIRVLQFADLINRNDFIDVILQQANRAEFRMFACTRTTKSNITAPEYPPDVPHFLIPGLSRSHILPASVRLAGLLCLHSIDILHTHHYDQAVIGWLATRLSRRTRLLVGRNYSDAIYLLSSGLRKKLLLTIESQINSATDRIIVPSKMISELLRKQGVNPAKVAVIYYAFHPAKWSAAEGIDRTALRARLGLSGLVFGHFSRMHREKGHTYLLKAVAKIRSVIPDVKVILVGEGPMRPAIEEEIAQLSLGPHIRLLGWRTDALEIMAAVDVVLHPTLQEAFPQTMIEALYLRKPLVITPVSGAVDIIEDGVNGLLIPARDPDALAGAMQRLSADEKLREKLGEAGRRFVEGRLSPARIIPEYEQVYHSLVDRDGAHSI